MLRGAFWLEGIAIVAAALFKFASPPPPWIEAHYSNGVYPAIDRAVRALTGRIPFCLGDVLLLLAIASLASYWFATLRGAGPGVRARLAPALLRTVALLCALFVWFAASWALNYARIPLGDKIPTHSDRVGEDSVAAFADRVVDELSAHARAAHAERLDDVAVGRRLRPTFEATIARLGDAAAFAPPRIKPTIFQPMLQLSGTTGFTDPWTHEVNLDAGALPVERPGIFAHEWAHVAGFADESEANFISAIACTTARDPLLAYSGWILVWFNLPGNVRISHRVSRLAYDDILAIRARFARNVNPQVEHASRVAYDGYLKSNHVKAGYESYRLFIRWMTGADFDANGLPVVRPAV